jgi:TolB protein
MSPSGGCARPTTPRGRSLLLAALGALAGPAVSAQSPPEGVRQTAWSPETATFVFTSQASGNSDLWLQRGASGGADNLTAHEAQDHSASWFPDGARIAFQSMRDGQREIYVLSTDGSGVTNLTAHPAEDLLPDVSPDGRRIVFFSDRGIGHGPRELPGNLYVMASDGGEPERLTREPLSSTFGADWSPDGHSLLFARDFDGDVDLVVLDLETARERRLPGTRAAEYGGRFSPDGRYVAFHAGTESGEARIVVMNLDGSGRRELSRGAQHYDPHWSPDGGWLMFTGAPPGAIQFDLLIVPSAGGEIAPLVATDDDERSGSWSETKKLP